MTTGKLIGLDLTTEDGCRAMQGFEDAFLEWLREEYETNGGQVHMQGVYRAYLHALANS